MRMTLGFLRNKVVEVEPMPDGGLTVRWRLTDDLLRAEVRLRVQPPDLEIVEAEAEYKRLPHQECGSVPELAKKVEGVRIGPGLRKIVGGLLTGAEGCQVLIHGVLESCNAVILHYTLPGVQRGGEVSDEEWLAGLREMLKSNPRLVRSCIAFQDDSPIMQGLEL